VDDVALSAAPARASFLPAPIVAPADSDAVRGESRDDRPVAAREDAPALALADAIERGPFLEGENGVVVLGE
jgi:hypothetical protein